MSSETIDTRAVATLKRKWAALSPTQRKVIIVGAAIDTAAKTAALVDLSKRSGAAVRGPKWLWAAVLPVVNSAGLLPAAYFRFARR